MRGFYINETDTVFFYSLHLNSIKVGDVLLLAVLSTLTE